VGGTVPVELKSLNALSRVHKKQMLTYLKLSRPKHELLINFGCKLLKHNIERLLSESDELAA
jgi:GxxExxY protein